MAEGLSTPVSMSSKQRDISDGTLVVRRAQDADAEVVSLCGELDLANAGTAETELREALSSGGKVVVDMRELEFIDSTGIALLVSALGQNGNGAKLSFIPSESPAVTRVLELTGLAERLPLAG
jgi:anti-anti-sigma factor